MFFLLTIVQKYIHSEQNCIHVETVYAEILRQLIAKTSAESLNENDFVRPQSPLSPSRFNGGDCKGDSSYIRHVVGKLKHLHRLKYKLADVSAGKLSTPETWARDTGCNLGVC